MIFPNHSPHQAGSYLYANDTCIFYQNEDFKKIENVLKNFRHYASSSQTISCRFILEKIKLNAFQRQEV